MKSFDKKKSCIVALVTLLIVVVFVSMYMLHMPGTAEADIIQVEIDKKEKQDCEVALFADQKLVGFVRKKKNSKSCTINILYNTSKGDKE
jgi:hypothetical protein